jgi:hypothetical protein
MWSDVVFVRALDRRRSSACGRRVEVKMRCRCQVTIHSRKPTIIHYSARVLAFWKLLQLAREKVEGLGVDSTEVWRLLRINLKLVCGTIREGFSNKWKIVWLIEWSVMVAFVFSSHKFWCVSLFLMYLIYHELWLTVSGLTVQSLIYWQFVVDHQ